MRAIGSVLRLFAFLFNLALSLALFLVALLVFSSGRHNMRLAPVPLTGSTLTYTLLLASIYGFVAMVLALRKSRGARAPMLLWNIVVAVLVAWTPVRGQFSFATKDDLTWGAYLLVGSLLALWGAWLQLRR
jgi:hypothetical protein